VRLGDREDRIDDLNNKISKSRQYILNSLNELKKLDDIRTAVALSEDKTLSDVL
jgi:hypothetical protein